MPTITTSDSVSLHYTDDGPEGAPPVVLIAGFTAAATSWVYQVKPLVAAGYRVIALDTRGHGLSQKPEWGNRMARRAKDLEDVLVGLGLSGVTLVGQSMGGNTVWSYLGLFGSARVARVVIVDQTPKMLNTDDWPHGFYGFDRSTLAETFAAGVPETGHGTPMIKRGRRLLRLIRAMNIRSASDLQPEPLTPGELALLQDHAFDDWRDVVARTEVPVLFVAGAESEVWPSTHAAASAALNPLAEATVIAQAGHATNIEQYRAFNTVLLDFLSRSR
jgi:non-heme chloroperoxidase